MAIVGIYITGEFEKYHLNTTSKTLKDLSKNIIAETLLREEDFSNKEEMQNKIGSVLVPGGYEILVIDIKNDFRIIASTNKSSNFINKKALKTKELKKEILIKATDKFAEDDFQSGQNNKYKIKHMAFPYIDKKGEVIGIIYGRVDLKNIYELINNSEKILLRATGIALFITIGLGFLIAKSITNPINDLTEKALKMAKGDLDQRVKVKSDDEIGKLGEMFNYLTGKLKSTLLEISGEKSKLDAIINQMADGLIAVDNEGYIIHVNPRFMKMMDLRKESITEKIYDEIFEKYNEKLTLKYIRSKNISQGIEVIKLEKGSILRANFVYLKNEALEVMGLILVLQDITEHENLNNMRKEFVANVSHELKTPITTVKSYVETLLDGAIEDKEIATQFLTVINDESDRMARLVKDLLQLSQLDHKKVSFNFIQFDLDNLIKGIIKKLEISFKEKNHILKLGLYEDNILIHGDKDKIEQVVQNILTNAIKYTPEYGVIGVYLKKDKENVLIEIMDNGIGIPKEDIPRIFERFYRVDKARSREMGGTGLGLSIAKHIIEEHGGDIFVESEIGKGSVFKIKLPVDKYVDM